MGIYRGPNGFSVGYLGRQHKTTEGVESGWRIRGVRGNFVCLRLGLWGWGLKVVEVVDTKNDVARRLEVMAIYRGRTGF